LTADPIDAEAFALQVERFYARLVSAFVTERRVPPVSILRPGIIPPDSTSNQNPEPSLGGKLFYAGELDAEARALIVAANIAGAATLAVSANHEAGKQAMRDGVVDFLVTTLDEALRILKNELRKRETVAVCVAQAPQTIAQEMQERGVLPDLKRPIEPAELEGNHAILTWRVASAPAIWMPKIDAIAADCLHDNQGAPGLDFETWESARRWLRLSPRCLGRLAQAVRVLRCSDSMAEALVQRLKDAVDHREIGAAVTVRRIGPVCVEQFFFTSSHS
jgi:urocanate hydratase